MKCKEWEWWPWGRTPSPVAEERLHPIDLSILRKFYLNICLIYWFAWWKYNICAYPREVRVCVINTEIFYGLLSWILIKRENEPHEVIFLDWPQLCQECLWKCIISSCSLPWVPKFASPLGTGMSSCHGQLAGREYMIQGSLGRKNEAVPRLAQVRIS